MSASRREFIGALAASSTLAAQSKPIPTRVLGRTGQKVTILAHGCGSRFSAWKTDEEAVEALNRALDLGIRYVDTAQGYGKDGSSERRVGMVMKTRRNGIFLSTKTAVRTADGVMRAFEESLKRLQTDHVDLLHIHSLGGDEDLAKVEAKDGALSAVRKLRDQKATRFIGITSHSYPSTLAKALEHNDFDVTQMALNAALIGMKGGKDGMDPNPAVKESFETVALPVANRKKMGVIAMKIYAQDKLAGQVTPEKLVSYVLSLPVTAVVVGMPTLQLIDSSVEIARNFKPMPRGEMKDLADRLSALNKTAHDRFFAYHIDA
jgi:aryl-alcohol dehydrogenase-like predicted oxidoreductase